MKNNLIEKFRELFKKGSCIIDDIEEIRNSSFFSNFILYKIVNENDLCIEKELVNEFNEKKFLFWLKKHNIVYLNGNQNPEIGFGKIKLVIKNFVNNEKTPKLLPSS